MKHGRHTLDAVHLRIFDILRNKLAASERPEARKLLTKLNQCGHPRPGTVRVYYCGSPSCPSCRDRRIRQERKRLQSRWSGVPARDLATVNIVLDVSRPGEIDGVGLIIDRYRVAIRNFLDKARKADAAWRYVEAALFVEVDRYHVDQIAALGSEKRRQINELRPVAFDAEGVLWVVTLHGLMHLGPDLSADEVHIALTHSLFPKFNQVLIRPLSEERAVHTQINDVTNYAMKSRYEVTGMGNLHHHWDNNSILDYALWMERYSRGSQSLKITYGLKKDFISPYVRTCSDDIEIIENSSHFYTACSGVEPDGSGPLPPDAKYQENAYHRGNMKSFIEFITDPTSSADQPVDREPTPLSVADPGTVVVASTPRPLVEERRPLTFRDVFEHEASPDRTRLSLRPSGRRITFGDLFRQA